MNTKTFDRLKGQPAIITGGATGIGKAVAIQFALEGAKVVVNYLKGDPVDDVIGKIREGGGEAIAVEADVSKEDEVKNLFKKAIDTYGTVHILVNNAGIQKDSGFVHMSLEDWQKVIDINLTGQFLCAREAAKEFLRRGVDHDVSVSAGKIIFMSSVHQRHSVERSCELCHIKGRHRPADAHRGPGTSPAENPGQQPGTGGYQNADQQKSLE